MAIVINEKRMVDDNIDAFEQRMKSKAIRFLDHTQTYVTYYHLLNSESTTDDGFVDIESIVGARSPFRYQKITSFPLYGIENLVPQLQDGDFGLDMNIEGEAVIMPSTIKPLQNSFFVIEHLGIPAVFRVTEITYDNIRPDNYYQIHYRLEYIDDERIAQLDKKVLDNCVSVMENIGSEEKCIIKSIDYIQLEKIEKMKHDMIQVYLHMYYDDTHNSLIAPYPGGGYLFDPFLAYFVNKNQVLKIKNGITSILLTDQFDDPYLKLKYERSFYRIVERRDISLLNTISYNLFPAYVNENSSFHYHYAHDVLAVDLIGMSSGVNIIGTEQLLSDASVESLKQGEDTTNSVLNLLMHFLHNDEQSIFDIPLDLNTEVLKLNSSLEVYFMTPVLCYVIDQIIANY